MKVFIDTGAFCAISNKKDLWHEKTSKSLLSLVNDKAIFYTSNLILSETYTLIRFKVGYSPAIEFMDEFNNSNINSIRISEDIEDIAKSIFKQYKDKTFSFVDCTSFALIDIYNIDHILTLDSHFHQYQFKRHVVILPENF